MSKKTGDKKPVPQAEPAKVISLDDYRKARIGKQVPGKISESVKKMGNASPSASSYKLGGGEGHSDDILEKFRMAEYLITIAMSVGDTEEKIGIAEEALKTFPDFTAAYNVLAEFKAVDNKERLAYFQKGAEAWERFHEFMEYESGVRNAEPDLTPYFVSLKGIADSLWSLNKREESIVQLGKMLKLEKHDLFGIRFIILARMLELGKDDEFYELCLSMPTDPSSVITWGKVLYFFRREERERTFAELKIAVKESPRVSDYLLGREPLPLEIPRYDELSKKSEQAWAASLLSKSWKSTVGALGWLENGLKQD